MTRIARTPQSTGLGSAAVSKMFSLSDVSTGGKVLPNRWLIYAPPGFGKTSLLAYAPNVFFLETKGETGLETLIGAGQLPQTPHLPELQNWADLNAAVDMLLTEDHKYKGLAIDTINGAEAMLHQHVCDRDFDGDMGNAGFLSYNKGYEVSLPDWKLFLNKLDRLREEKGMTIFLLAHSRVKTFANPGGANYDRYMPEMHEKTWAITKGWVDNILFGNFEVVVRQGNKTVTDDASKKGKVAGSAPRILYTNSDNPVFEAKNRVGLEDEIELGETPKEGWSNLAKAIIAGRKVNAAPTTKEETNV